MEAGYRRTELTSLKKPSSSKLLQLQLTKAPQTHCALCKPRDPTRVSLCNSNQFVWRFVSVQLKLLAADSDTILPPQSSALCLVLPLPLAFGASSQLVVFFRALPGLSSPLCPLGSSLRSGLWGGGGADLPSASVIPKVKQQGQSSHYL